MKNTNLLIGMDEYCEHSNYFPDFYRLLTSLGVEKPDSHPKVIIVSSAKASEGKTTLASYLAITAAMSTDGKYLLVDGDFRRPGIHHRFGLQRKPGLAELLRHEVDPSVAMRGRPPFVNGSFLHSKTRNGVNPSIAICASPFFGLDILPIGEEVSNPFELLRESNLTALFTILRQEYQLVIVDAPPVVPVGDTQRFASCSDGVVMVVKAGKTSRELVRRAVDLLKQNNVPILGIVLNDLERVLPYYYQSRYYSYRYRAPESVGKQIHPPAQHSAERSRQHDHAVSA